MAQCFFKSLADTAVNTNGRNAAMHGSVLMLSNSPDPSLTLLFLLEDQGTKLQLP